MVRGCGGRLRLLILRRHRHAATSTRIVSSAALLRLDALRDEGADALIETFLLQLLLGLCALLLVVRRCDGFHRRLAHMTLVVALSRLLFSAELLRTKLQLLVQFEHAAGRLSAPSASGNAHGAAARLVATGEGVTRQRKAVGLASASPPVDGLASTA